MGVFKTKAFARFARRADLADETLLAAAKELASGSFDADLGGGVFKQRVARQGGGKSGGFRTIIVFRAGGHSYFVHGFAKNEKANVSAKELKALKLLARELLGFSGAEIEKAIEAGELTEVNEVDDDGQGG